MASEMLKHRCCCCGLRCIPVRRTEPRLTGCSAGYCCCCWTKKKYCTHLFLGSLMFTHLSSLLIDDGLFPFAKNAEKNWRLVTLEQRSPWNYTEQVLVSVRGIRTHRTGLYRCLVRMQKGILREFHKYILKHSNLRGPGSQIFKRSKEGEGGCWINKLFRRGSHKIMTWTEKKTTIPSPPPVVYRIQWNCFYTGESREQALFMAHKKRAAANCGTRCLQH